MYLDCGTAPWPQRASGGGRSTREGGADSKTSEERCRFSHSPVITRQTVVMWQVWDQAGKSARQGEDWYAARPSTSQWQHRIDMSQGQGPGLQCNPWDNGWSVCAWRSWFSHLFPYGIGVSPAVKKACSSGRSEVTFSIGSQASGKYGGQKRCQRRFMEKDSYKLIRIIKACWRNQGSDTC